MRGSSAKSLDSVLAAVSAAPASSTATVGSDLLGAVTVIDKAVALRRVLTDPSTETAGKHQLLTQVFHDKVSAETFEILRTAVAGRWAAARDLTDGLEIAGVSAWTRAADSAGQADALEDELFTTGQIVHDNAEVRSVISDRAVSVGAKASLLQDLFGSKVTAPTLAVLTQAAAARGGSFEKVLERFGRQVAAREGRIVAVARVAYELSADEHDRLAAGLAARYGSPVQLNTVVDPTVIGGIAVSVGDEVVDATMSTRLESARRLIAG